MTVERIVSHHLSLDSMEDMFPILINMQHTQFVLVL